MLRLTELLEKAGNALDVIKAVQAEIDKERDAINEAERTREILGRVYFNGILQRLLKPSRFDDEASLNWHAKRMIEDLDKSEFSARFRRYRLYALKHLGVTYEFAALATPENIAKMYDYKPEESPASVATL